MSFPRYPRYKPSGVEWLGEVPVHWEATALKRFCETITDGAHISPETENGIFPFVSTKDVGEEGIDFEGCLRTSVSSFDYMVNTGCRPVAGDVLFSKDGTIGRTIVVGEHQPFVVASSLIIIRPERALLASNFLHFLCQSNLVGNQVESVVKGAGLPRLSIQNLVKVMGCFPPLAEQTRIVEFLDRETAKIDELVAEQRRLMELLKEKRQAVISHAVTRGLNPKAPLKPSGIEWLGDVPAHWEAKPLRRFSCLVQSGPFGSQLHSEEYVSGGTPVINPTNMVNGIIVPDPAITVTDEVVRRLEHQRLRVGDVVFSRRGELGRCALVTEREEGWLCGTGSMILRLHRSEYHAGYLSRFLSLDVMRQYFESFSIGSVMDSLSSATLLAMPMIVPPVPEQDEIAMFIDTEATRFDTLTAEAQRAIDLLQERRTALISAAVTGQIDVRHT